MSACHKRSVINWVTILGIFFFSVTRTILSAANTEDSLMKTHQSDQDITSIDSIDTVTAVILKDFPPLYLKNQDDELTGFAVELLEEVSGIAGISYNTIVVESWAEAIEALQSGQADFIPGIGVIEERENEFLFSVEIVSIPVSIFCRKTTEAINSLSDLKGKKVAVIEKSAAENTLVHYPEIITESMPNIETLLISLLTGEVDAVVCPQTTMNEKAGDAGVSGKIKVVGKPVLDLKRAYMFRNEDVTLYNRFNKALKSYLATGDYLELYKKWYEQKVYWTQMRIMIFLSEAIAVIALIAAIVFFVKLRRSIKLLADRNARLDALFSSMTEMVVLHELILNGSGKAINYRIIDCNQAFTRITGIKKENAVGKLATEVYGTELPPYLEEFSAVVLSGKPYEYTTYFPPLDKHFSISVVSPGKNQFATVTTDITVIKQIQNSINAKNKELENYLFVASHDLRSPLVNIQGFSRRLQKNTDLIKSLVSEISLDETTKSSIEKITEDAIPKTLDYIFTNVIKMDTLINGLLQISRTGRIVMTITRVDMNRLIRTIIKAKEYQIAELAVTVNIGELQDCYGDENLLNQLFSNLIANAISYRDDHRPLIIDINSYSQFSKVVYSIRDNGLGIADRHLERIWDVFFRVNSEPKKSGEGIGLNIVKRIVDKHKGRVWVESEEDKGSIFYIELQKINFISDIM